MNISSVNCNTFCGRVFVPRRYINGIYEYCECNQKSIVDSGLITEDGSDKYEDYYIFNAGDNSEYAGFDPRYAEGEFREFRDDIGFKYSILPTKKHGIHDATFTVDQENLKKIQDGFNTAYGKDLDVYV